MTKRVGQKNGQATKTRYGNVTEREARAAARAKVTVDRRRGRPTPKWIEELAEGRQSA